METQARASPLNHSRRPIPMSAGVAASNNNPSHPTLVTCTERVAAISSRNLDKCHICPNEPPSSLTEQTIVAVPTNDLKMSISSRNPVLTIPLHISRFKFSHRASSRRAHLRSECSNRKSKEKLTYTAQTLSRGCIMNNSIRSSPLKLCKTQSSTTINLNSINPKQATSINPHQGQSVILWARPINCHLQGTPSNCAKILKTQERSHCKLSPIKSLQAPKRRFPPCLKCLSLESKREKH